jgi:predicted transcriptional regulator
MIAGLLTTVDREGRVSQRQLSMQLGVTLGPVNTYVKRCVKMGLIKIRNVPSPQYIYYLTPKGFRSLRGPLFGSLLVDLIGREVRRTFVYRGC